MENEEEAALRAYVDDLKTELDGAKAEVERLRKVLRWARTCDELPLALDYALFAAAEGRWDEVPKALK